MPIGIGERTSWNIGISGRRWKYFQPVRGLETQEFLAFFKGVEYGAWITENGRSVGSKSAGDLIQSFPHVIEWILREQLAIPTEKIDITSFDSSYTTLSGWDCDGVIMDARPAREHIENLLSQCKSRLFKNNEGKWELSTYNSGASVDYSDYKFNKDDNIFKLKITRTPVKNVFNNVRVKYRKNSANGEYRKETWIKCTKVYSGSLLNEALDDSETSIDVDDGTDFNTNTRSKILIDDEMMTISGIAANTLTVFARGQFSSTARTHNDNTRIYIIQEDSSDNDTTREQNAMITGYTYHTYKE